jgi:signal transduction histidine kinase
LADRNPSEAAPYFDERLIKLWPTAEVGFVVTLGGSILSPPLLSRPEAKRFRIENDLFLSNQEKMYWPSAKPPDAISGEGSGGKEHFTPKQSKGSDDTKKAASFRGDGRAPARSAANETEFRDFIGSSTQGILPRFLQNRLKLLVWYRSPSNPELIFGAQLNMPLLTERFQSAVNTEGSFAEEICLALLDENGRPVARSHPSFTADWKRPFVALEIGDILPHWEVAAYLLNPLKLSQSSRTLTLTLSLLVMVLLLAIAVGSWLIVSDLKRQLTLARQKADFVSNVSHELKTPLTSIRMFSELLAEDRVSDAAKRRDYLQIIGAEAARLTRLINNVLDFARIERGEKQYHFEKHDLTALVRETVETYRPHLEAIGFTIDCKLPKESIPIEADRDAIAQILVNLLSNAEKYSSNKKQITVLMDTFEGPSRSVTVRILDRGSGVPPGCEEKIFEQFFRAHDSLSSGVQGSGLGLTLARRLARAHGGEIHYEPRGDGGSCFSLRLPLADRAATVES